MDMWDSIRRPNTHIIGVPEGEKIGQENVFEEMMARGLDMVGTQNLLMKAKGRKNEVEGRASVCQLKA